MAGFLDSKERILDVVLTSDGKRLLAAGDLAFVYFAAFDDGVDYDPILTTTASLSPADITSSIAYQIEATPLLEPVSGYRLGNISGSDYTNVRSFLFTMPQGKDVIPRVTGTLPTSSSLEIYVSQRKVQTNYEMSDQRGNVIEQIGPIDSGFERLDASNVTLSLTVTEPFFDQAHQEGFFVRVLESGSEGFREIGLKRDKQNRVSFDRSLIFKTDD